MRSGSEPPVAQAVSEVVAITRTASRSLQHPALDVMGSLHSFEALGDASGALTGASEREQEKEHGERHGAVAQGGPRPRAGGNSGEESGDYRWLRFQSSIRT